MVYDTLTSLVESAKSVFQPRNENDINSFENFIFNNYITDMEDDLEQINEEHIDHVDINMNLSLNLPTNHQHHHKRNQKNEENHHHHPHSNDLRRRDSKLYNSSSKPNSRRSSSTDKKLHRISMIELSSVAAIHENAEKKSNLQRFSSMQ